MAADTMSMGNASMRAVHRRAHAPFKASSKPVVCKRAQRGHAQVLAAASSELNTDLGFATMRDGVKVAADESILTPRFYTTDFDQMEELFSKEINPYLDMEELNSCLEEFRNDYNQRHFVRNETFKPAADGITGETRKIFIEFLERSCTAEFSGFLLYKELGRRLRKTNPAVAEMFALMSRDEARHAGFINKAMGDFNLALDLGFLTKNRKYTFFQPKFIIYATFLSEKIGYWRYICIYRHLQRNPEHQLYPMFEYFENWCQDENRHGDFLAACLKARPELVQGPVARLWSRFFCLSVYITMYLNDHSRTAFYESLGMETKPFNQHVIIETNKSAERIFPEVPDVEHPDFFGRMDRLLVLNKQIQIANKGSGPLATLQKWYATERLVAEMAAIFFMPTKHTGSFDLAGKEQLMY